jgi:hypothetical protein
MATYQKETAYFKSLKFSCLNVVLLCAWCCLLQFFNMGFADWYYFISALVSFVSGYILVKVLNNIPGYSSRKQMRLAGLLLLSCIIVTGMITVAFKFNFTYLSFQLLFVIPFFINQTYKYYLSIPVEKYRLWYYPLNEPMPEFDIFAHSETTERFKFVFSKDLDATGKTSFIVDNTPIDKPLGQVFFNLIDKNNKNKAITKIEFSNQFNQPVGWIFYTKKGWLQNKWVIDPDLSFRENVVNANDVIFADREVE